MENEHVYLDTLNQQVGKEYPDEPRTDGCLQQRDAIIAILLDATEHNQIPEGVKVYACSYLSAHEPHYWVEVEFSDGKRFVWDRTNLHSPKDILPLEDASQVWSRYNIPDSRTQVIPERAEESYVKDPAGLHTT